MMEGAKMSDEPTTYRGKKITYPKNGEKSLSIEGMEIPIGYDKKTEKYFTNQIPHLTFDKLSVLAMVFIDMYYKKKSSHLEAHYLAWTTGIGIGVASIDLFLLHLMNSSSVTNGIGLAMVGIVTFFGMLLASSVFEEHRHHHSSKPKKDGTQSQNKLSVIDKTLANVVAGKGIMRKAVAGSLIVVYIILIGLYADNGELNEPFPGIETSVPANQESEGTSLTPDSDVELTGTIGVTTLQLIQDNGGESESETNEEETKTNEEGKETKTSEKEEDSEPTKPIPRSLLEHFTTVITVIIGFYFGSSIVTKWLQSKYGKDETTGNETPENGEPQKNEIQKKLVKIEKRIDKIEKKIEGAD